MSRYVVRGKDENGRAAMAAPDPAEDDRIDGHLPATDGRFATFATIDDAEQARRDLVGWGCTDVRICDADTGDAAGETSGAGKGYVVRGKIGPHAVHADRAGGEYAYTDEADDPPYRFDSIAEAQDAAGHLLNCECVDVRIYDADTGAVVPTYAEALARLEQIGAARSPLTDAQVEGFAQTAMDDICKGTERPRNAVARAIRAALNAAGPEATPLTAVGAMALWERAYRAAYAESGPGEPPPDERLAAMLAGHQAVLDAVASPAGSEARTAAMEAEIDYRVRRIVAQRTADKLAEMDALLADEPTPDPAGRPESGPMRFGDDWAGVFLRGDYAGPMGMFLERALDMLVASDPIFVAQLRWLASTLSGCDERGTLSGLQQMRPFEACVAAGSRPDAQPNGAERGPADPCDEAPCPDLACRWCWGNRNGA